MIIERGKIEDDIELDNELVLHGMVNGNVRVVDGEILVLNGMCSQNLVIEEGGRVYLHGTTVGNVHNNGGYLEVYGTINGYLRTESGNTQIDPDADIKQIL